MLTKEYVRKVVKQEHRRSLEHRSTTQMLRKMVIIHGFLCSNGEQLR